MAVGINQARGDILRQELLSSILRGRPGEGAWGPEPWANEIGFCLSEDVTVAQKQPQSLSILVNEYTRSNKIVNLELKALLTATAS